MVGGYGGFVVYGVRIVALADDRFGCVFNGISFTGLFVDFCLVIMALLL